MREASSTRHRTPGPGDVSRAVIAETNRVRAEHGRAPVRHHRLLWRAARARATHMSITGAFSHDGWVDAVRDAGYLEDLIAENIAAGQPDPAEVVADWFASPGHRRNMLDPNHRHVGVSWSVRGDGARVWVQLFGG